VNDYKLDNWGLIEGRGKYFCPYHHVQKSCGGWPSFLSDKYQQHFPWR